MNEQIFDTITVEFDILYHASIELSENGTFSITQKCQDDHATAKIANKDIEALEAALREGFRNPKNRHAIHSISITFNKMRLPRMQMYVPDSQDENGFRQGLGVHGFDGFTFISDCDPKSKLVTIMIHPHQITDADKTYEQVFKAFVGFARKTVQFARSGDAITNLIRALRKQPTDEGYISRAIHTAYGEMSKQARY